jgi:predicted histidine transporter YuiF (NhaC family)
MVVRRVGVLSLNKVLGVLYALLGLIVGALFAIVSLSGAAVGAANSPASDAFVGLLFGLGP